VIKTAKVGKNKIAGQLLPSVGTTRFLHGVERIIFWKHSLLTDSNSFSSGTDGNRDYEPSVEFSLFFLVFFSWFHIFADGYLY